MSAQKQFRTGLCDCCDHPSSCIDVACCFPCQVARQKQITLGLAVGAVKRGPTCGEQTCLCVSLLLTLPIAVPILGGIARTYVYKGYGVEEPCTCCCDNCCNVGCFCPCCSLCQTYREHALRGNCSSTASLTCGGSPFVLPPKPSPIDPRRHNENNVSPITVIPVASSFVDLLFDSTTAQSALEWKKAYETRNIMNEVTSNAQRVNSPLVAIKVAWFFAMLCQDSADCRTMASNKEVYALLIQRCCSFASADGVLWIGNAIGNIVASNIVGKNLFSTTETALALRNVMKSADNSDAIEFLCYCIRGIVANNDEGAKIFADTPNFVNDLKKLQVHAMTTGCREEYDGCVQVFSRFASSQLIGQLKEQGNTALATESFAEAVNYFTAAINIDPNDKELYSCRSAAYAGIRDFANAKKDAETCISRDSTWFHGYSRLGAALQGANQMPSALAQFEKALVLAPYDKKEEIRLRIAQVKPGANGGKNKNPKKPDPKPGPANFDLPTAGPFKRVKELPFEEALRALLTQMKQPPHGFEYLADMIPDLEDADAVINYINGVLDQLKKHPQIVEYQSTNGLTDDEVKALHAYKLEDPYPVYRWLNAWLMCSRRDDNVKKAIGPFFILLNRAMSKLPKFRSSASRAIMVRNIPALRATFENHKERCAQGEKLSFWGFASFSTDDDVINSPQFIGENDEPAIIFSCGSLEGIDMEPFAPSGMKEKEILPLCPTIFEVQTAVMVGCKLTIAVKQLDNSAFAYVRNEAASTSASGVYPSVG